MYKEFETRTSYEYLQKVIAARTTAGCQVHSGVRTSRQTVENGKAPLNFDLQAIRFYSWAGKVIFQCIHQKRVSLKFFA